MLKDKSLLEDFNLVKELDNIAAATMVGGTSLRNPSLEAPVLECLSCKTELGPKTELAAPEVEAVLNCWKEECPKGMVDLCPTRCNTSCCGYVLAVLPTKPEPPAGEPQPRFLN